MNRIIRVTVYLQNADGSERELQVTMPEPNDGTICAHINDDSWVRIIPTDPVDTELEPTL